MKLEVGMFIRTPLGIDKIIYLRIQDEYGCNFDTQLKHNLFLNNERDNISIDGECFEKEEIKASHNIIDILEVGDYVNGHRVEEINFENEEIFTDSEYYCGIVEFNNVKSVITHEQMEQMAYKVEE